MDLKDNPEQAAFRAECRAWVQANAPHHLRPKLEASSFGKVAFAPDEAMLESKAWQKKKAEAGWACLHWPKEYGGRGASPIERVIWSQEEGLYSFLSSIFIIGHGMCGPTLLAYATEEQKRRYLPPMASGEEVWCQLFSEPGAGSDLAGLRMRAELDGDEWVVNGQKVWTSGAHYSDYGILVTRSDFSVAKHKGLTYFFVDMRSPGIEVRGIRQAAGESGFNEVYFTNVRIPDSQRLGAVGDGWAVSITTLMNERLAIGGSMPTGWDELFRFARAARTEDGRAIDDPAIREQLADWYVRTMGLRYTNYRTLTALSKGQMPGPESSIGKVVAGNTMQEIASLALELQDQCGALVDHGDPIQGKFPRMLMRSLGTRIEGGTDEILKNIIAERVLQLPGDVRVDRDVAFKDIPSGKA
jgi:alkylation response protein AidB-like acyl-CoA dehydrogenase